MVNYRTYITLLTNGLFNILVQYGIIDLSNPVVSKESLEVFITVALLLLAAVFRKFAGKPIPLFTKKPKTEGGQQ